MQRRTTRSEHSVWQASIEAQSRGCVNKDASALYNALALTRESVYYQSHLANQHEGRPHINVSNVTVMPVRC